MPDYTTASRTKDHFQTQLLREHPEIVSIAPQLKLDAAGNPTQEGIIVVGVGSGNPLQPGSQPSDNPIPLNLPAIDFWGHFIAGEEVTVVVTNTGYVVPHIDSVPTLPSAGEFNVGQCRVAADAFGANIPSGLSDEALLEASDELFLRVGCRRGTPSHAAAGLVATLANRITVDPEQCGGRPCVRGMRIRVSDILDLLA